jgi:hypothetical protein
VWDRGRRPNYGPGGCFPPEGCKKRFGQLQRFAVSVKNDVFKEVVVVTKNLLLAGLAGALSLALSIETFAQAQPGAQNRIPQQVIINGQTVNGAYVTAPNGGMQSFTCSNPQPYVTPDSAAHGWACFDQATGVWLLNAVPPAPQAVQPAPVPAQPPVVPPAVIYQQPATVIYTTPAPVVYAPVYPSGVVLGTAVIDATGRIVSAALLPRYPRGYYFRPYRRW